MRYLTQRLPQRPEGMAVEKKKKLFVLLAADVVAAFFLGRTIIKLRRRLCLEAAACGAEGRFRGPRKSGRRSRRPFLAPLHCSRRRRFRRARRCRSTRRFVGC
jgi:hypothetical protein